MGSRINDLLNSNTKTADATMNAAGGRPITCGFWPCWWRAWPWLAGLAVALMFRARMSRPLATLVEAMEDMAGAARPRRAGP
jgi:hypothetical protein